MFKLARPALFGAFALAGVSGAFGADIIEPPYIEAPPPAVIHQDYNGWYIRGDIDYHRAKMRGTEYITYGCDGGVCGTPTEPGTSEFASTDLEHSWSLGGGIGYQATKYLRTDLTADYWFKSDFEGTSNGTICAIGEPCSSTDESEMSALVVLANAYVDLGTYHRVTPYVGAGIGGAHVRWEELRNTIGDDTTVHDGEEEWRFAWSVMAGASYCLTNKLDLDLGYRYTRIHEGKMFSQNDSDGTFLGVGPGTDDGFNVHEVRGGLRYNFGGSRKEGCGEQIAYQPEPIDPVYK